MANISANCDSIQTTTNNKDSKAKSSEVTFEESISLLPSSDANVNSLNIYHHNNNSNTNETSKQNSGQSTSSTTIGSNNSNHFKSNNCQNNKRVDIPPDGGWGWVVVFASFMINFISDGVSFSFGIIFLELVDHFGESKSKTSWVGSLFLSIPLITGPIASALIDHFGCRRMAIIGSIMSSTGFIAGHFANRLEHLFIAFSFSGLGLALCYVASIVSVAYYFEKRRSLATGLAVCGSGFGTFLFPPLTIYLLKEFRWRKTLLIIGVIFLTIIIFGALMKDFDLYFNTNDSNDIERADHNCDNNNSNTLLSNKTFNKICSEDQSNEEEMKMNADSRLCSSLIHIPTYFRHNDGNTVSHEVISELSLKKGGYLRRLLQRHPKLVAFIMPQEYQNYDLNVNKSLVTNALSLSPTTRNSNAVQSNTVLKMQSNKTNAIKKELTTDTTGNYLMKSNLVPIGELSPLSSNLLRNLRLQRGSITYRNAMLNIKKYKLRASSAPDIYRNSMVAIHEKSGFLYNLKDVFLDMIDLSNFKSFRYSLFCFSNFLLYVCIDVPYVYLPDQTIISGSADKDSFSYVISIIGIFNTLGIVFVGYFGDKRWVDPSLLYSCFIVINGFSLAIIPWLHNFWGTAIMAALYGFTISANYALVSIILVNLISLDSFTNAYGLLLLVQGFGSLVGPPIAGWLFDYFGDYNVAFHLTGICIFISGALVVPITRSSNCLTVEDDFTEITESSRPNSPRINDSIHSSETQEVTQNQLMPSLMTSVDTKNLTLKVLDNGFNKNVLKPNAKSFDGLNNSLIGSNIV
ncbi:uncharacterized protein LOC128965587 [Oppia nitens]|uniref:uncharacterized protein LOC128965587 n=1 Tax=Oppia nitens TaxID=1686743 RepID=UPI0023DA6244|nr:uncharacterized protein LOC128965587 [Oppia nitens]